MEFFGTLAFYFNWQAKVTSMAYQVYATFPRGQGQWVQQNLVAQGYLVDEVTDGFLFFQADLEALFELMHTLPWVSRMGICLSQKRLATEVDTNAAHESDKVFEIDFVAEIMSLVENTGVYEHILSQHIEVEVKASRGLRIDDQLTSKRIWRLLQAQGGGQPQPQQVIYTTAEAPIFYVNIQADLIWCGLQASTKPLHQRFGVHRAKASLKEDLAASVLAPGPRSASHIIDPFCGAGTLLFEALRHVTNDYTYGIECPKSDSCMGFWSGFQGLEQTALDRLEAVRTAGLSVEKPALSWWGMMLQSML